MKTGLRYIASSDCKPWQHGENMIESDEPIHDFFELSYAEYLVIPRSVLQSMPKEWQAKFVECLRELDRTIDWRPHDGTYRVQLYTRKEDVRGEKDWGHRIDDPLADYSRGRRRIERLIPKATKKGK